MAATALYPVSRLGHGILNAGVLATPGLWIGQANIGLYAVTTASSELIGFSLAGIQGPTFLRNGSAVDTTLPGSLTVTGNLTINGTTTSVNSTVVDVSDRVIRVNKSTGANDPAPTNICGISVYRGAVASVARDHYGLFWDESATEWKLAVNTGGDDATLGAYLNLHVLGLTAASITLGTQTANTIYAGPTTGSAASPTFRAMVNADLPTAISVATVQVSGVFTSTLATGTAPFTVASTTAVTNLNSSLLLGSTWASPAAIGTGTPAAATFTSLTLSVTPLSIANGGTASTTAAAARSALGLAIDQYGMQIEVPTAKTYYVVYVSEVAFTINRCNYKTVAGTCTLAIKINGVAVTGLSALSVTTSDQTTNGTAANSVAIGDTVTAVVTSPSSIQDLIFNLKVTI